MGADCPAPCGKRLAPPAGVGPSRRATGFAAPATVDRIAYPSQNALTTSTAIVDASLEFVHRPRRSGP